MYRKLVLATALLGLSVGAALADDVDELAKKTQNPVGDLISVPFQFNVNPGTGPFNRTQELLNIQPVAPISVAPDWNFIVRPIIPLLSQPVSFDQREYGLGDIQLQTFLTPKHPGSFIWGIGPVVQFPSRTDVTLGAGMWGAGVGAVFMKFDGAWNYGALVNHVWSIGDPSPTQSQFSTTTIQPFINYNFGGGWAANVQSLATANWDAMRGQVWTVPVGAMLTKTFKVGAQPMSLGGGVFYNVVRPDNAGEWQVRVQYTLIFPK